MPGRSLSRQAGWRRPAHSARQPLPCRSAKARRMTRPESARISRPSNRRACLEMFGTQWMSHSLSHGFIGSFLSDWRVARDGWEHSHRPPKRPITRGLRHVVSRLEHLPQENEGSQAHPQDRPDEPHRQNERERFQHRARHRTPLSVGPAVGRVRVGHDSRLHPPRTHLTPTPAGMTASAARPSASALAQTARAPPRPPASGRAPPSR